LKKSFDIKNIFQRFKGLFSIGVSDIFSAIITAGFWFYVATLIDVDVYGELFYILAIGNVATSISLLGSRNTLMVYVPKNVKIESAIFLLVIIFGIIVSLVAFFYYANFALSIYILGGVLFGLGVSEILAKKLYANYLKFLIPQKFFMVTLSLGLYYLIGINGIILGMGLSFFPYLLIVIKEFKTTKIDFPLLKPRLGFMMNSYGNTMIANLSKLIDVLMVAPLLGFTLLGNYQLGFQFIGIFQLIPLIVMKFTLPHDATGNTNRNLKIVTVILSLIFTILILLITPIVIPLLFQKFIYVIEVIQILSLSLIPLSVTATYISKFLGAEKHKIITIGTIILIITHFSGILILGNIYGINGVAMSYVLSIIIQTTFYYLMDIRKKIT